MVNEHASDNLEIEGRQSEWHGVTVIGHASNHFVIVVSPVSILIDRRAKVSCLIN